MNLDARPIISEVVVVEGLHDRQAVERAVQADVWVLGGDRVAHRTLAELRRAATSRGVIVLTDPDGPGERIRRRVADAIPGVRHAFLSRRLARSSHGVGVEHAPDEAIVEALLQARQTVAAEPATAAEFSLADLEAAGLVGTPDAAQRRQVVGEQLGIGYGNAKAFVRKLNVLGVTREEWKEALVRT
ncbi:ribonuclease M5 [Alicyclobacillus sp. ALC3]|uniref:ribonuclease M5 n=1 Tax=Alicyclobacillus sp. ALC3 TaxID=2796143 RepID=UPI0023789682|nr:ribonuclease M5 [Alicyclobacillus sp. ALC3]WDL99007.1 ribonuclease M5 [Alicyclobacillus sp. ALC3]